MDSEAVAVFYAARRRGREVDERQRGESGDSCLLRRLFANLDDGECGKAASEEEEKKTTHLESAPASNSISITPYLACSFSSLTAKCSGVARSRRFCKSTSVPSVSRRRERASGEGAAALRWRRNVTKSVRERGEVNGRGGRTRSEELCGGKGLSAKMKG